MLIELPITILCFKKKVLSSSVGTDPIASSLISFFCSSSSNVIALINSVSSPTSTDSEVWCLISSILSAILNLAPPPLA